MSALIVVKLSISVKQTIQNFILLLALILLSGCATETPRNPDGRPNVVIGSSGCAILGIPIGAPVTKAKPLPQIPIPPGKALIFIYTVPDIHYCYETENIQINGTFFANLRNGTVIPYFATPGKIVFAGKKGPSLNSGPINLLDTHQTMLVLNAEAGKTYFVRFSFKMNLPFRAKETMENIPYDTAAWDITFCKLRK